MQLGLILEYGRKLLHLPLSYFEGRRSGEVVSRIADVHAINNLVSQIVLGLPSQFFIAVVSLGFMLFYTWELTLASIVAFLIITAINLLFLPAIRQKTRNMIVSGTENQGFVVETFRGVQVLKTTQATAHRVIQRADWIVFLEQGQLKIQGKPEDLRQVTGEHLDFLDDVLLSLSDAINRVST